MGIYIGGFDPLKLIEGILNKLVQKNILSREEAQQIIDEAKIQKSQGDKEDEK